MSAVISECGSYRYQLSRELNQLNIKGHLLFIMLNPSTADANLDDPTIRRCKAFAEGYGYSGLIVANLYALRTPSPKNLWLHPDPIGPENDNHLYDLSVMHTDVVCAWGNNAEPKRVKEVALVLKNANLWCLGTTKSGQPKHPLYIKSTQDLVPWVCPN